MLQRRKLLEELLYDLFNFIILYSFFSFILVASSKRVEYGILAMLAYIAYLAMFVIRKKVNNFYLFIALNMAVIALALISDIGRRTFLFFNIFIFIYSVKRRINYKSQYINMGNLFIFLGCLFLLYIGADYFEVEYMRAFYFIEAILAILIVMVHKNVLSVNNELEVATAGSIQPVNELIKFNNKVLLIYTAVAIFVMASFKMKFFVSFLNYLGFYIILILRWLFSKIRMDTAEEFVISDIDYSMDIGSVVANKEQGLMDYIEWFLVYAVNIAVALAMLGAFIALIVYVYKAFNKKSLGIIETESIVKDIERNSIERKRLFNRKPKDPVRRKFYNRVIKYYKKGRFDKSDTPTDIKEKLLDSVSLDIAEYENARYTKNEN